jgi:hypothetical protein
MIRVLATTALASVLLIGFSEARQTDSSITDGSCATCKTCLGGHYVEIPDSSDTHAVRDVLNPHGWCMQVVGCTGHPSCSAGGGGPTIPGGADESVALLDAIGRGEVGALERLQQSGQRVVVDQRRNSVFILACSGSSEVVAVGSLPIPGNE